MPEIAAAGPFWLTHIGRFTGGACLFAPQTSAPRVGPSKLKWPQLGPRLGHWPTPKTKTPAPGGLGLMGDRSIAFSRCRSAITPRGKPGSAWQRLFAAQHKVVAVDHLSAAGVAKDQQHVGG
jgi:hypothetical protein